MDVIIVGAGVGGLALANGLAADGHAVRVLERSPDLRTDGAAVTIFSNGAAAAAGLGVPLDGLGGAIETLEFCTPDGRACGRTDLRVLRRRTGFGVATVPRVAILERFAADLTPDTVAYGCAVSDVTVRPDGGVVLTEADGTRHTADVAVGADGYRSAVRRSVLGDGDARRNGWTSWQGLTVSLPALAGGTYARCVVGPAGLCGLMPAGGGLLQWWFDVAEPAPDDRPVLDWLRARFAVYTEPVGELLGGLTPADVQEYPHVLHRVPTRWGTGSTTLVGDAAHAFPPTQAQGANQALEDAWLLRRALSHPSDVVAALRRYEHVRSRRVRRIARLAASEVTNRLPTATARLASRLVPPAMMGHLQLAVIRWCSSVLNDERL
jgi:FAD-dependent urate hydroxylase